jgi:hypothetical protein
VNKSNSTSVTVRLKFIAFVISSSPGVDHTRL